MVDPGAADVVVLAPVAEVVVLDAVGLDVVVELDGDSPWKRNDAEAVSLAASP